MIKLRWPKNKSIYNIKRIYQQVIGDKKGGKTTNQLKKLNNVNALEEIKQVVEMPMKFLHVVRNPYDNIATMLVKALNKRDDTDNGKKVTICLYCIYLSLSTKLFNMNE